MFHFVFVNEFKSKTCYNFVPFIPENLNIGGIDQSNRSMTTGSPFQKLWQKLKHTNVQNIHGFAESIPITPGRPCDFILEDHVINSQEDLNWK